MVIYEWNDSIEKTLDVMRQNAAKLGELSLGDYHALKQRIHYLQLPLAILSAANAYAVYDLDHYVSDNIVSIACCVVSASLAGYLSYDWYVDSQNQMERDFSFHRNCTEFSQQLKDVLSLSRYDRTIDGAVFLRDKLKLYKVLVSGNKLLEKFNGDLTWGKEEENMEEIIMDHWNIIFRPTLRRFKKKNMEIMECVKKGGQSINDIVEDAVEDIEEKGDLWKWLRIGFLQAKKEELKKDIEEAAVGKEDKKEEAKSEEGEKKEGEGEEKAVNFSDVYTVKDVPSMNFPAVGTATKKFHVAFTEQI